MTSRGTCVRTGRKQLSGQMKPQERCYKKRSHDFEKGAFYSQRFSYVKPSVFSGILRITPTNCSCAAGWQLLTAPWTQLPPLPHYDVSVGLISKFGIAIIRNDVILLRVVDYVAYLYYMTLLRNVPENSAVSYALSKSTTQCCFALYHNGTFATHTSRKCSGRRRHSRRQQLFRE